MRGFDLRCRPQVVLTRVVVDVAQVLSCEETRRRAGQELECQRHNAEAARAALAKRAAQAAVEYKEEVARLGAVQDDMRRDLDEARARLQQQLNKVTL